MSRLFIALLAAFAVATLTLPDTADAKRFGGGKSLGKTYSTPQKSTAAPRQTDASGNPLQSRPAPGTPPRPSGASRWLGPLAGLAAGGLLASLFMGDGFEGVQILDFLLIAALVIGGFMLFRALRKGRAGGGLAPPPFAREVATAATPAGAGQRPGSLAPEIFGQGGISDAPGAEAPAWFDAAAFVEAAKTHFIRLQAAWDRADFRDIRDYTTPQLFAEIKRERELLGDAPNYTEVVTLEAELLGIQRDRDLAVASLRFSGLVREDERGGANRINEIWHIQHVWSTPDGDWLIAGIDQPDG